jgi:3-methylfumaryl-CoA hydratase
MTAAGLAVQERQNLVYRDFDSSGTNVSRAQGAPAAAQWSREITADPVLLFRYSALTFNSHRIHYDRDYARDVEGYGDLVVQGPLTATLMLDTLESECPGTQLRSFEFRGLRPLLAGEVMSLQGRRDGATVQLWALDARGNLALQAQAELR